MLQQNSSLRRLSGQIADAAAAARPPSAEEIAARRAAALIGEDSPLRPGAPARPSLEFVGALGRLSEAFRELKTSVQAVEEKVDGLSRTLGVTRQGVDGVRDRLAMENARFEAHDARIEHVESRQAEAMAALEERVAALARHVSIAMSLGLTLAIAGVAALILTR